MVSLNHIGIAVRDPSALTRVLEVLGFSKSHLEDVPEQGVRTHFIPLIGSECRSAEPVQIELLEVLDPLGTVARFLETRGPGVHHLSFEVDQGRLDSTCEELRQAGVQLIYETARKGAHGMRVNFIHPKSAGGVLLEVMEKGSE